MKSLLTKSIAILLVYGLISLVTEPGALLILVLGFFTLELARRHLTNSENL